MSSFGDFFAKLLRRSRISSKVDEQALAEAVMGFVLESLREGKSLVLLPNDIAESLAKLKPGTYGISSKDAAVLRELLLDPRNDIVATAAASIEVNRRKET
jgi:hypothetical protein